MNPITIRAVTPADAEAIAAIFATHVLNGTATFETVPPGVESWAGKISVISGQGAPFLVAEGAGGVVGYAYATQFRDRPAYRHTCENSIYIAAHMRGQGIGSLLLRELMNRAEAKGFRQMIAVIGGGEPASIALHAAQGFRHAGRMQAVGRKFGTWLDTVYMQRALGAGDGDVEEE